MYEKNELKNMPIKCTSELIKQELLRIMRLCGNVVQNLFIFL